MAIKALNDVAMMTARGGKGEPGGGELPATATMGQEGKEWGALRMHVGYTSQTQTQSRTQTQLLTSERGVTRPLNSTAMPHGMLPHCTPLSYANI